MIRITCLRLPSSTPSMPWPSLRSQAGYTLIEVLVAAAVFVSVFVTIALLFARTTSEYSGWQILTAAQLAQTALEGTLAQRTLDSDTWTVQANGVSWQIEKHVEEAAENLWSITISVRRVKDQKAYASLWTQVCEPTASGR